MAHAPELSHYNMPGQPYARKSTEYFRKIANGKKARVSKLGDDQYGRCSGRICIGNNDLSVLMVMKGSACVYVGYNAIYGKSYDKLKNAAKKERKAKKKKLGMWKDKVELPM